MPNEAETNAPKNILEFVRPLARAGKLLTVISNVDQLTLLKYEK